MQTLAGVREFSEALALALALAASTLSLHACGHAPSGAASASAPAPADEAQPPPERTGLQELTDTIVASSAIVVATAGPVDDRAGLTRPPHDGGVTRVTLHVEQVLHGAAALGERELWFPGGVNPDGTISSASEDPPSLLEGDRYILFLREAPPARLPLVRARLAVLRIVRFGDQERVVDEYGRGVITDARQGLRTLGKISEAMLERSIAKAREQGSGLEYVSQDRLEPADIERASPLSEVLALIVEQARKAEP